MSFRALRWAFEQPVSTSNEWIVLVTLANHADPNGISFPGQKAIADKRLISKRSVVRAMQGLESLGLIKRQQKYRRNGNRGVDTIHLQIDPNFGVDQVPQSHLVQVPQSHSINLSPPLQESFPRKVRKEGSEKEGVYLDTGRKLSHGSAA